MIGEVIGEIVGDVTGVTGVANRAQLLIKRPRQDGQRRGRYRNWPRTSLTAQDSMFGNVACSVAGIGRDQRLSDRLGSLVEKIAGLELGKTRPTA